MLIKIPPFQSEVAQPKPEKVETKEISTQTDKPPATEDIPKKTPREMPTISVKPAKMLMEAIVEGKSSGSHQEDDQSSEGEGNLQIDESKTAEQHR